MSIERKKVFITFGGPGEKYYNYVNRLCGEMQTFNWFDEIKGYTDQDLKQDTFFWERHSDFIESNPRGYGYWIWKSYLIQKNLTELNYGDILIYADAGCYGNVDGKPRLLEYIDMLDNDPNQYGIISLQMNHLPEENWTKKRIFDELDCNDDSIKKFGQCIGGVQTIKKTDHSVYIINKWVENMKYHLLNDDIKNEDPCFMENRHDQSIYSCLVKKYGSIKIPDETYDFSDGSHAKPILTHRFK